MSGITGNLIIPSANPQESTENKEPEKKLTEYLPKFPKAKQILIDEEVFNSLLKYKNSASTEGILFGRERNFVDEESKKKKKKKEEKKESTEEEKKEEEGKVIEISSAIPCSLSNTLQAGQNINHITTYLLENRLDSMRVGFFCCSEGSELLSKEKLTNYIEFQKIFPNSVIITFDIELYNSHVFPFQVFRISDSLIQLVTKIEIEENLDSAHNKEEDFYQEIFKNFTTSGNMIEYLKFTIREKPQNLFRALVEKKDEKEDEEDELRNINFETKDNFKFSLNRKM
ncbi:MAG: hypothetical protein MJ252_07055 [archaeon]|nr:hypothetical protein [archaeon]